MTGKEMHFTIKRTAARATNIGWTVDIDERLPYVGVSDPAGPEYWFQGQEASDLLREAGRCASTYDCTLQECVLWFAQGW